MARYRGPHNKLARRFQVNIFEKARNPMLRKANPPGQHGGRRKKKSDFGLQLEEKQKLKAVYGMISEKQLVKYFREAVRRPGNTPNEFISQLECRLDVVVYRLKLAKSIFHAHQLVSHKHILVDGKVVNVRSFQVKPGMVISLREKSRNNELIKATVSAPNKDVPEYYNAEPENFSGSMLSVPEFDQIPLPLMINIPVVCEFLAHTN